MHMAKCVKNKAFLYSINYQFGTLCFKCDNWHLPLTSELVWGLFCFISTWGMTLFAIHRRLNLMMRWSNYLLWGNLLPSIEAGFFDWHDSRDRDTALIKGIPNSWNSFLLVAFLRDITYHKCIFAAVFHVFWLKNEMMSCLFGHTKSSNSLVWC